MYTYTRRETRSQKTLAKFNKTLHICQVLMQISASKSDRIKFAKLKMKNKIQAETAQKKFCCAFDWVLYASSTQKSCYYFWQ